jgi:hypothetical protein
MYFYLLAAVSAQDSWGSLGFSGYGNTESSVAFE